MTKVLGAHYFLTIVDGYSNAIWVYLMTKKSKSSQLLINFSIIAKRQYEKSIECVRSDNGQEFKSRLMLEFYR